MDWDVVVVGAGPAGCFAAMQIAQSGYRVVILEEHPDIGRPVQCSGLISPRAIELAGVNHNLAINNLTGLRVLSPLGSSLLVRSESDLALAIDRSAFDRELAAKAENAGAVLLKGTEAKSIERITGGFRLTAAGKNKEDIRMSTKILIGADGADSDVAGWLGLKRSSSSKAVMFAADVRLQNQDTDVMNIFLGQNLAPGWFGWIIPIDNDICRVGTGYALLQPEHSPWYYFQQMTNRYPQIFNGIKVIRYTGGTVPFGLMPRIYAANAMLLGDAACQTKPISGGGIFIGLKAAQICAKTAVEALSEDNLSEEKMSCYQKLWEKDMKEEISSDIKLRESFLDFKDGEIDLIVRFLNKPKYHNLISKYGDIDYPSRLAKKLISFSPWKSALFKFTSKIAENADSEKNFDSLQSEGY